MFFGYAQQERCNLNLSLTLNLFYNLKIVPFSIAGPFAIINYL